MRWDIDIDDHTRFQSFSLYFLMFIHIGSRRIWISPCTANPTGEWTAHQARNSEMYLQEENLPRKNSQCDRDTKYVAAFDHVCWLVGKQGTDLNAELLSRLCSAPLGFAKNPNPSNDADPVQKIKKIKKIKRTGYENIGGNFARGLRSIFSAYQTLDIARFR